MCVLYWSSDESVLAGFAQVVLGRGAIVLDLEQSWLEPVGHGVSKFASADALLVHIGDQVVMLGEFVGERNSTCQILCS